MTVPVLLTVYCALILLASLLGGWLPLVFHLTHRGMQIAISFVAGVMLGMGLLHLVPHALHELKSIDVVMFWALVGFLLMFFLERFFHFHHHDAPEEAPDHQHSSSVQDAPHHDHAHHSHEHHHEPRFSWAGAAVGLSLHSIIDGVALAAGVAAEAEHALPALWPGLGVFLAVLLHKPFDSLSIGTLMAAAGWSAGLRHAVNALFALAVPVGVLLFQVKFGDSGDVFLGRALAFAGGAFICIATSDLLPELQFHSHDRIKLSLALLFGILLAWLVIYFEAEGHEHDHNSEHAGQAASQAAALSSASS